MKAQHPPTKAETMTTQPDNPTHINKQSSQKMPICRGKTILHLGFLHIIGYGSENHRRVRKGLHQVVTTRGRRTVTIKFGWWRNHAAHPWSHQFPGRSHCSWGALRSPPWAGAFQWPWERDTAVPQQTQTTNSTGSTINHDALHCLTIKNGKGDCLTINHHALLYHQLSNMALVNLSATPLGVTYHPHELSPRKITWNITVPTNSKQHATNAAQQPTKNNKNDK